MGTIPVRSIHTHDPETDLLGSFRIRELRGLLSGKDMIQEVHRHDFFFILVLKKGRGKHEIDFQSYQIRDRAVFMMRPGQVHQLMLKGTSEGYLIEFKPDFFNTGNKLTNQLLRSVGTNNHCLPGKDSFTKILTILGAIFREYTDKPEVYQEVIKANLTIFFIELIRNRKDLSGNAHSYEQERLEEFLELVEKHISTHKKVSQYANILHLSSYQLNAISKVTLGKTGSKVIDEHIILEAKRYLLSTTSQVNQTAFHLGFDDVSYFIRFFKKHTGYSPEAFRLNFK